MYGPPTPQGLAMTMQQPSGEFHHPLHPGLQVIAASAPHLSPVVTTAPPMQQQTTQQQQQAVAAAAYANYWAYNLASPVQHHPGAVAAAAFNYYNQLQQQVSPTVMSPTIASSSALQPAVFQQQQQMLSQQQMLAQQTTQQQAQLPEQASGGEVQNSVADGPFLTLNKDVRPAQPPPQTFVLTKPVVLLEPKKPSERKIIKIIDPDSGSDLTEDVRCLYANRYEIAINEHQKVVASQKEGVLLPVEDQHSSSPNNASGSEDPISPHSSKEEVAQISRSSSGQRLVLAALDGGRIRNLSGRSNESGEKEPIRPAKPWKESLEGDVAVNVVSPQRAWVQEESENSGSVGESCLQEMSAKGLGEEDHRAVCVPENKHEIIDQHSSPVYADDARVERDDLLFVGTNLEQMEVSSGQDRNAIFPSHSSSATTVGHVEEMLSFKTSCANKEDEMGSSPLAPSTPPLLPAMQPPPFFASPAIAADSGVTMEEKALLGSISEGGDEESLSAVSKNLQDVILPVESEKSQALKKQTTLNTQAIERQLPKDSSILPKNATWGINFSRSQQLGFPATVATDIAVPHSATSAPARGSATAPHPATTNAAALSQDSASRHLGTTTNPPTAQGPHRQFNTNDPKSSFVKRNIDNSRKKFNEVDEEGFTLVPTKKKEEVRRMALPVRPPRGPVRGGGDDFGPRNYPPRGQGNWPAERRFPPQHGGGSHMGPEAGNHLGPQGSSPVVSRNDEQNGSSVHPNLTHSGECQTQKYFLPSNPLLSTTIHQDSSVDSASTFQSTIDTKRQAGNTSWSSVVRSSQKEPQQTVMRPSLPGAQAQQSLPNKADSGPWSKAHPAPYRRDNAPQDSLSSRREQGDLGYSTRTSTQRRSPSPQGCSWADQHPFTLNDNHDPAVIGFPEQSGFDYAKLAPSVEGNDEPPSSQVGRSWASRSPEAVEDVPPMRTLSPVPFASSPLNNSTRSYSKRTAVVNPMKYD